ncbi:Ead domain protein [Klebsiella pneumoniae]|nr:ead/Ea22-like family protein [Klebsiella pneumoniae]SXK96049.1 Ead domain protein [Klebsiella pneumoniae]
MTDITELAQRMRIAATMASQGAWSYARSGFNSIVRTSANLPSGGASRVVLCKLFRSEWRGELKTAQDAQFIALANPANVLTLVEALEKAQTINAAAEKLVRCKGRYHSEQNYRALAALFGVNTPDLPPLDDDSHAVTVENLQESAYRAGLTAGWNLGLVNNNDGFNKCLAAHAAGIKVEAE